MKHTPKAINPLAGAQLLYRETQPENTPQAHYSSPGEYLLKINQARVNLQQPMASAMSMFNPLINVTTNADLNIDHTDMRAHWQNGMILLIKSSHQAGVKALLTTAKNMLSTDQENCVNTIVQILIALLPAIPADEKNALIDLAKRFDFMLADNAIAPVMAENLLRDCLFYLSQYDALNPTASQYQLAQAWNWNAPGQTQLYLRMQWYAKQLSNLVLAHDGEEYIDKSFIYANLLPVTDALLCLNEIKLRTRLQLRLDKIDERMLKISVPVQKLMAECLRLSV